MSQDQFTAGNGGKREHYRQVEQKKFEKLSAKCPANSMGLCELQRLGPYVGHCKIEKCVPWYWRR